MSLGNFFKRLLAEKQAESFTLVQDNAAITTREGSSARPTPYNKIGAVTERKTKERPTMTTSVLNADPVAPKLPLRQASHDALDSKSIQSVGSRRAAPKLPLRKLSPKIFSRKRLSHNKRSEQQDGADSCTAPSLPLRQKSRDKVEQKLEPIVEQKRYQNAIFGSPRGIRLRAKNKPPSAFASFCEDTRSILVQLPYSRGGVDLIR